MNDNIIINTISKIHFVLVSIISFILSILFIVFVILQNGLYIDGISFPNVKSKQLYIKWNEKINITIKDLYIYTPNNNNTSKIDYKEIGNYIKKVTLLDDLIEKIFIENISYNDIKGSFSYLNGEDGFLNLSSSDFTIESSLYFDKKLLNIQIDKFKTLNDNLKASGNIILDITDTTKLISLLKIKINNNIDLKLYTHADRKRLSYKIESNNNIKSVKEIIDNFTPDWEAKWWVREAINMSSLTIDNAYGYIEYANLKDAYKHLHVEATVNKLKYTYDENLDVIDTSHTKLEFKNGILHIKPQNAYTYDFHLDKSNLNIDFTKEEVLVNLFLNFEGKLNKDLLYLLKNYKINLPFIQNKGKLKTDLKLVINLKTTDVEAHGSFYTKDAQINYLGLDIDVKDANVILHNTDVTVMDMFAQYKNVAKAQVDIKFNGAKDEGSLDFRLNEVSLKELNLVLDKTKKPLHAKYVISKEQDFLYINKSNWIANNTKLEVEDIKLPFDIDTLSANIPLTFIKSKNISAFASGKMLFKPIRLNLDIDLTKFDYYDFNLTQKMTKLKLIYDEDTTITAKEKIFLHKSSYEYVLDNLNVNIKSSLLNIKNASVDISSLAKTNIDLQYDLGNKNGFINLNHLSIENDILGEIFKDTESSKIYIKKNNDKTILNSEKYNFNLTFNDYETTLDIVSLTPISKYSKLLQNYSLDNGLFKMSIKNDINKINFTLDSIYKYQMLVNENNPINKYTLYGSIDSISGDWSVNVNNLLHIYIEDDIKITTKDIGLNISEITKMISSVQNTQENKKNKNIYFNAKNSYVYLSKTRHAISDTIDFSYENETLNAKLKHKNGIANFILKDNKFNLYGENFNDKFMNELFALSEFKNGTYGFLITGMPNKYKGVMHIHNSIIIDYKVLNNVLAFVNTVPSLVTFSLPNYSKKGLDVDEFYLDFTFQNDIYSMNNIHLESQELDIAGKGEASIKNNTIDIDLNLKTDLGSSVSKIPIVGYILLGEDTISTSLTLNGALDDPKITTQVAQDIIVAPLNILKRTFTFPLELFKSDKDK